jgi:hypothetical protein
MLEKMRVLPEAKAIARIHAVSSTPLGFAYTSADGRVEELRATLATFV